MEQYSIISYVAAWLATVALVFVVLRCRPTTTLNLPPSPKPWPIIGNLNLIGPLPHRSVHELSKQYGQIMRLKFGSKNIVVGSSVHMAKVFLKTMDINFVCHPKTAAGKYPTYNYFDITWPLMDLIGDKHESLINVVHKLSDEEIMLKYLLGTLSLNVITRMVLGKKILDETEVVKSIVGGEEFKKMVYEWFLLNIPWIGFIDLQGYVKRSKTMSKNFDLFLENVLNEHDERRRLEAENFVPKDMVDLLLQIHDDTTLDVKFERHGVKAFTLVH
ncbi:cytochrome P450 71A1-like protein [Tanacetum coccineum]